MAVCTRMFTPGINDEDAATGEIGPRNILHELLDRGLGTALRQHEANRVGDLEQVVRRHVRGHAHGDAAGAIGQKIGEARRQHFRLRERAVVVFTEIPLEAKSSNTSLEI